MSQLIFPKHDDGSRDKRYTCGPEYCGYSVPLFVVRFCGERIGAARDEMKVNHIMSNHHETRQAVLEGRS